MMEEKNFYIRILSPVHIGCDEIYDPTGFVISEEDMTLTAFDPLDFFRSLSAADRNHYAAICGKGTIESILELYKFMKGKRYDGHCVGACKGLVAQYLKTTGIPLGDKRKIQQELNNFSISRTAFNPTTQKPYLPGSAIKGAFRTAYLNYLAQHTNVAADRRGRNESAVLERALLEFQTLDKDPFRLLKISDFHPVGPCTTDIVYAVNAKKAPSRFPARGPCQILEIIAPGAVFAGNIQVLNPLARDAVKTPLVAEKVFGSARAFYEKEKQREEREMADAGLPVRPLDSDGRICPLRIGRHSGAESLTIAGHRHIKIMKKRGDRPEYADKATTFWLASDFPDSTKRDMLQPFGWVNLGALTEALSAELSAAPRIVAAAAAGQSSPRPEQGKIAVPPARVEETWEQAQVSFEAGKGGIITARGPEGRKAQLIGKEKALAATDETLQKKLFEGKKTLSGVIVTVQKVGNAYEIVHVGP